MDTITLEQHMEHRRETSTSITKLCPWCEREREAIRDLGRRGGKAGRGEAKRRGDSAYYKALRAKAHREPEHCDDCGERVGYYDPNGPEGDKIVITRRCSCVRENEARRLCRRCRLPQEISSEHEPGCTWNPRNRISLP